MSKKKKLLEEIRTEARKVTGDLNPNANPKNKASAFNRAITRYRDIRLHAIKNRIPAGTKELIDELLLASYSYHVVMLETRNSIWNYDYMAFSRRIGEIWEPFCKIPFENSIKTLSFFQPPRFEEVQTNMQNEYSECLLKLNISPEQKQSLSDYYLLAWDLIDSGSINLSLDMHFEQNGNLYNVDFKSGFSSNEKGNTNRLLQVAGIYSALEEPYKCLLFVRQEEDQNNHYLQTLKNSPYWNVYCANNAYLKMREFTGYDIKKWMEENIDWLSDFSEQFANYVVDNDFEKYLTW